MADTGKSEPTPVPGAPAAEGRTEPFLSRWSRLKQEASHQAVESPPARSGSTDPDAPPPELPPLDKHTFDSDYGQFFHPRVDEAVRRSALKKLFSNPHFNVMDGLDVYIDDYSKTEPIPPAMLAGLKQAQNILKWARGEDDEPQKDRPEVEQPLPVVDATQVALQAPVTPLPSDAMTAATAPVSPPVSSGEASRPGRS